MPPISSKRDQLKKQKQAIAFLEQIKSEYMDDDEVFNRFVKIMADFQSQRIGTTNVVQQVTDLFNGHPCLIREFVEFLPPGHVLHTPSSKGCIEISTPSGEKLIVDSVRGVMNSS
ncbi:paired amphipathic helix [Radiomyces spectabilis]|uniref:paired amphipathic helix n=1 Tax=Radiomyces spectabilis TaxID=64574 RepID=UPI00221FA7A6|nr:paired amphipathic helix [Radiomyces spectabilis]KAI8367531.1 paired amphipathic helix [Radiomyces spectabilis]